MPYTCLDLGDATRLRISVVRDPAPTLISLVADVFGRRPQGVSEPWRRLVRSTAPPDAAAVLHPLFAPTTAVLPDCISPEVRNRADGGGLAEYLTRIRDTAPEALLDELHTFFGADLPRQWRPVSAAPARWLNRVADVMASAWEGFAPVWSSASVLFDREFERVGTAVVRGATEAILLGFGSRRHRYQGGRLYIEDRFPEAFVLGDRTLALTPIVSSSTPLLCELDRPDKVWLGYAMPGQRRLCDSDAEQPRRDTLAVAVGPARAVILRMLTAPATMSDVAKRLNVSPPAATYHCRQLEDAGLLVRRRNGSHIHVQRTVRGGALVDIFSSSAF
ncbi:DNA-binding transcriptional ArsR family regulator [Catenulispora sp. GP43]|uniref:winged helix-turn-helix domain-containing protein n=1 Tax=Catenulispora sp. GP43 TaxID=3156263 RepID=UPI0035130854